MPDIPEEDEGASDDRALSSKGLDNILAGQVSLKTPDQEQSVDFYSSSKDLKKFKYFGSGKSSSNLVITPQKQLASKLSSLNHEMAAMALNLEKMQQEEQYVRRYADDVSDITSIAALTNNNKEKSFKKKRKLKDIRGKHQSKLSITSRSPRALATQESQDKELFESELNFMMQLNFENQHSIPDIVESSSDASVSSVSNKASIIEAQNKLINETIEKENRKEKLLTSKRKFLHSKNHSFTNFAFSSGGRRADRAFTSAKRQQDEAARRLRKHPTTITGTTNGKISPIK